MCSVSFTHSNNHLHFQSPGRLPDMHSLNSLKYSEHSEYFGKFAWHTWLERSLTYISRHTSLFIPLINLPHMYTDQDYIQDHTRQCQRMSLNNDARYLTNFDIYSSVLCGKVNIIAIRPIFLSYGQTESSIQWSHKMLVFRPTLAKNTTLLGKLFSVKNFRENG